MQLIGEMLPKIRDNRGRSVDRREFSSQVVFELIPSCRLTINSTQYRRDNKSASFIIIHRGRRG